MRFIHKETGIAVLLGIALVGGLFFFQGSDAHAQSSNTVSSSTIEAASQELASIQAELTTFSNIVTTEKNVRSEISSELASIETGLIALQNEPLDTPEEQNAASAALTGYVNEVASLNSVASGLVRVRASYGPILGAFLQKVESVQSTII